VEFTKSEGSVFLNGKAQIIEMLEFMTASEKNILLNNIKQRNPSLAVELQEKSLSFNDLNKLSDHEISVMFTQVRPEVLGLAIKDVDTNFQRRVLSLAPRNYAETAYTILVKPIKGSRALSKKAQNKIVGILINLSKRGQVQL
jgi:flagellar motor switch protein FliG